MATRNCPIGADGIVQKRPRTVVTSIRRHPGIWRALPITAGRHIGGARSSDVPARSGTEVVIRVIERMLWALGNAPLRAGYRAAVVWPNERPYRSIDPCRFGAGLGALSASPTQRLCAGWRRRRP